MAGNNQVEQPQIVLETLNLLSQLQTENRVVGEAVATESKVNSS